MEKVDKIAKKCANMAEAIYKMCQEKEFTKAEMLVMLGGTFTAMIENNYEPRLWMLKFEEVANEVRLLLAMDALKKSKDDKKEEEEEEE